MPKKQTNMRQLTVQMDSRLYLAARDKCKSELGIGLSPLIKMFLKAFVTQRGVGFWVGDDDLCRLFSRWLSKKRMEIARKGCAPLPGPRLRDIYELKTGA